MLIPHWTKLVVISKLQVAISANLIVAASAAAAEADAATVGTLGAAAPAAVAAHAWLATCIVANTMAVASLAVNEIGLAQALVALEARAAMKAKVASLGAGARTTNFARRVVGSAIERGSAYVPV